MRNKLIFKGRKLNLAFASHLIAKWKREMILNHGVNTAIQKMCEFGTREFVNHMIVFGICRRRVGSCSFINCWLSIL